MMQAPPPSCLDVATTGSNKLPATTTTTTAKSSLSPLELLERAYLLSGGNHQVAMLLGGDDEDDEEYLWLPPSSDVNDGRTVEEAATSFPRRNEAATEQVMRLPPRSDDATETGDFLQGMFDYNDDQDVTQTCCMEDDDDLTQQPLPCCSSSETSSIQKDETTPSSNHHLFSESLQRLNAATAHGCCHNIVNSPSSSQATTMSVQDAMDMIDLSNESTSNDFAAVILTLTSFPFRIVHASDSLLLKSSSSCLGAPLSDVVITSAESFTSLLELTPTVPTQCTLQGDECVAQAKLIPVVANNTYHSMVYYAIVLQQQDDFATDIRPISPLSLDR